MILSLRCFNMVLTLVKAISRSIGLVIGMGFQIDGFVNIWIFYIVLTIQILTNY